MVEVAEVPGEVVDVLSRWATAARGAAVRVENIRDLGGHSGETYAFTIVAPDYRMQLVARFSAAAGDDAALMRQVPLLGALYRSGVKAAVVRDASLGRARFGAGFLIVDMLPGRPLVMGPDAGPSWLVGADRQIAYEAAAAELAKIHRPDIARCLGSWAEPRSPADEIELWVRTYERAAETEWTQEGAALREALLAKLPEHWTAGLCHGDFQTNNVLFALESDRPSVSGVVDWEIAHVGSIEHDLAWFLMMNDDQAWHPQELRGGVDLERLVRSYADASGRAVGDLSWFWALACYRIAAIAGHKIRLHRTGRKIDAAWERASTSMPFLFARAHTLLARA